MYSLDSKIKDLYRSPIGHDALYKVLLQLGLKENVLLNPVVGNLKLKTIQTLLKPFVHPSFFDDVIELINIEKDHVEYHGSLEEKWWKEAVFYQIYPRSFMDHDGDGIGDLKGIISKLDYLENLGVNALWLSPIYKSPNDDNGYDISDYYDIMDEFGTMEDFDTLLNEIHQRGMKLIMDLVVNHTSDEHEWFQKALKGDKKYQDYYIFRKNKNNWTSFFSGSAWNYYPELEQYALHLFSKKQMDLNWENEEVRNEVIKMINWWLDKGVDGFRLDVINYISKKPGLPEGNKVIGDLMGYTGIEHYYYGPKLHDYLKEISAKAFKPHNAFSVGETPGIGMEMAKLLTSSTRNELDMVFSFDHLDCPGHIRFDDYAYDLNYLRDYLIDWCSHYGDDCWMSLFYNNHDNPRMISKVEKDAHYHEALSILLAVIQFTHKGTPFIYQGDEMGLANVNFTSMDQITDVEAKGYYAEHIEKDGHEKTFNTILSGTREHTRILLPWNEKLPDYHAGLRQSVNPNVEEAYRKLIALRKTHKELIYGDFEVLDRSKNRYVYKRGPFVIDCNLGKEAVNAYPMENAELIFSSHSDHQKLEAYGTNIYI